MARTVLNLDEDLLKEAGEIFGTETNEETVRAALQDAVDRHRRRELFDWIAAGNLADLADEELMKRAWG